MARPKSEDKKQALLEAATVAIAHSGIGASTATIARGARVAEGTLFRYFATKDELLRALYLHLKQLLCRRILGELDLQNSHPKVLLNNIWNSYIDWGMQCPDAYRTICQLEVSDKIDDVIRRQADELFPELNDLCEQQIRPVFRSDTYRTFGDRLFMALAETTIAFASRDPERASEVKSIGFETMWRALAND